MFKINMPKIKLSKKTKQLVVAGVLIAILLAIGYVLSVNRKAPVEAAKATVVDTVTMVLKDTTKAAEVATDTKAVEAKKSEKK